MKKVLLISGMFCSAFFFSQKSQNYLQISYNSICCGTPSTEPVMNYLNQFRKKNKVKALDIYRKGGFGREGEFKLYIGIDKLSKMQKISFIKGLRTAIEKQNSARQKDRDGIVNFNDKDAVTKADLSDAENITIYKK